MDTLMLRCPHLFERTFRKLNSESLFKSREVARSWKYFINERNYSWLCVVNIPTILKNSNTYLHLAAETGQIDAFKTALIEEVDKNIRNCYRETSFHLASGNGHSKIVELLLFKSSLNIDLNAVDFVGKTAFHLTCEGGHSNVVKLFMNNSARLNIDLNAKDVFGSTACDMVC